MHTTRQRKVNGNVIMDEEDMLKQFQEYMQNKEDKELNKQEAIKEALETIESSMNTLNKYVFLHITDDIIHNPQNAVETIEVVKALTIIGYFINTVKNTVKNN